MKLNSEHLYIIDCIGPFFLKELFPYNAVINWSKIPFTILERNGIIPESVQLKILFRLDKYAKRISSLGFNAVSVDDLVHISILKSYDTFLKSKILSYQIFYKQIFLIFTKYKLKIFMNTDVTSFPGANKKQFISQFCESIPYVFNSFPEINGIIFRIGEGDGQDVNGIFRSQLVIKTPSDCRSFIKKLLPIFEKHTKEIIIRTWTIGAFRIGDLIWNEKTFLKVFKNIYSKSLIISHKYGDSDFFYYLTLNKLIWKLPIKRIIEFQTRREYEGFGMLPSFTGYYYENILHQLSTNTNLLGISVWCQTGGWSKFFNLTFLDSKNSFWNEVNTIVLINLVKKNGSILETLDSIHKDYRLPGEITDFYKITKTINDIILNIWYYPEFSSKVLFFRKTRIPPIVWIFWDTIFVNEYIRYFILNIYIKEKKSELIQINISLDKFLIEFKQLIESMQFFKEYKTFYFETVELLIELKKYMLFLEDNSEHFINILKNYQYKHNTGFTIKYSKGKLTFIHKLSIKLLIILLRNHSKLRGIDLIINMVSPIVYGILSKLQVFPKFAQTRAMGIKMIFK